MDTFTIFEDPPIDVERTYSNINSRAIEVFRKSSKELFATSHSFLTLFAPKICFKRLTHLFRILVKSLSVITSQPALLWNALVFLFSIILWLRLGTFRICEECLREKYYEKSRVRCQFCDENKPKRVVLFDIRQKGFGYR